jgi:hypothetical protein
MFEESIGIEPNTLTGTHCLAGKPYRHQGLLSVECGTAAAVEAPTLVIPLFVRLTGIEPITFRVSGGCSNQLSYKRWWRQLRFYRTRATLKTIDTLVAGNPSAAYY